MSAFQHIPVLILIWSHLATPYRLISHPRSYPFHLHLVRSLVHLTRHTHTYFPIAPYILPILTATLSATKSKASTLRPLDLEIILRAPQQYLHTRVYTETIANETVFLTAEWLSVRSVHGSIAFPELVVPIVASLRHALKTARSGAKVSGAVKALVERIEESARWVSQRRAGVTFAPGDTAAVGRWEADLELDDASLIKYARLLRKTREKQRKLVEKVSTFFFSTSEEWYNRFCPTPNYLLYFRRERARARSLKSERIGHALDNGERSAAPIEKRFWLLLSLDREIRELRFFFPSQPRVDSCSVPAPWKDMYGTPRLAVLRTRALTGYLGRCL